MGEEALDVGGVLKSFDRDQEIFGEGEEAEFVYKVVSGSVRCFRGLCDGRRQISDFYLPGDVFGLDLSIERRETAEAMTEVQVTVARRSALAADPANATRLWRQTVYDLQRSQEHALTLGRRSASERVASFLVDLAERTSTGPDLELPMTRQDIADYLGLTIETVSRTLTQLQAQGLIKVCAGRRLQLTDLQGLADLCE
jgi:CRP/FNR family nitrogen fixation transcriptional regulator